MDNEWRPMDTAPRDGTRIIGQFYYMSIVVQFCGCGNPECGFHDRRGEYMQPLAWRPIDSDKPMDVLLVVL